MSFYGTGFPPGVMPMTPPASYGAPGMPNYGSFQAAGPAQPPFVQPVGNFPGYPPTYGVGPMMSGSGQPPTDIYVRRPC